MATLNRWFASDDLLPKPGNQVDLTVRAWYAPLFALMDRPQKPTLRWAHDTLIKNWRPEWEDPEGSGIPDYSRVRRAYTEKRSELDKLKGRHTCFTSTAITTSWCRVQKCMPMAGTPTSVPRTLSRASL